MRLVKSALLAAAVVTAGPTLAHADKKADLSGMLTVIQRLATHYALLTARSFVDLTWEQLTVEPGTNQMVISGLKIYPVADWDKDGKCQVTVDRVTAGDAYSFDKISTGWEISGVKVPGACFPPMAAQPMAGMKYDGIEIDSLSMEISYAMPTSSAELVVQASVKDVADISLTAEFGYLWFTIPMSGRGDPKPVVHLKKAEIAFTNRGIFERVEPMAAAQMGGDLSQISLALKQQLSFLLSEGGARTPTAPEMAFIDNLADQIARFVKEKNALVVTAAPKGGVWLDKRAFSSASTMIAALAPRVSRVPDAHRAIISPDMLKAALASDAAPDDATRMKVGKALVTGIGAPQSLEAGWRLLEPLAKKWNGEAAYLLAEAGHKLGGGKAAYEMALRALAAGNMKALGVADKLEAGMNFGDILSAQSSVVEMNWPGRDAARKALQTAMKGGDVSYFRKIAGALAVGRGVPRSYQDAYTAASLAAAGGDRSAAKLRARLNARFGTKKGWREMAGESAKEALSAWTDGFGAAIAAGAK